MVDALLHLFCISLTVSGEGDFDHEPGLPCNQIGKYHQVKVWIPVAPLSFILFFRLRQQMLLSSGFIVHA